MKIAELELVAMCCKCKQRVPIEPRSDISGLLSLLAATHVCREEELNPKETP